MDGAPDSILTLDVGNSRLKACTFAVEDALEPVPVPGRVAWLELEEGEAHERLTRWLEEGPRLVGAAVSSVAGPKWYRVLLELLGERIDGPVAAPPGHGLHLDVRETMSVGHDRLFAARAALTRVGAAAIVVDAGTALTVDAVLARPDERGSVPPVAPAGDDRRGIFLGGAIAPGPTLLARALAAGGRQLPSIEPRLDAPALGRDTRGALEAGVAVGFAGAARRLVQELRRESGLIEAPLLLTGGSRAFLRDELGGLTGRGPLIEAEHLVHEGLLHAALGERGR